MSTDPRLGYHVGIICTLPANLSAVIAMMDEQYHPITKQNPRDENQYVLGRIHHHKVVVACLPSGRVGHSSAGSTTSGMLNSFLNVRVKLLVGNGGGLPNLPDTDIRLGDVVVSQADNEYPAVVQYDFCKSFAGNRTWQHFEIPQPSRLHLSAVTDVQRHAKSTVNHMSVNIEEALHRYPLLRSRGFLYPGVKADRLNCDRCSAPRGRDPSWQSADYMIGFQQCGLCDGGQVNRHTRRNNNAIIHYGVIASGRDVISNAVQRERLRVRHHAKCVNMEAAGLMQATGQLHCAGGLVICGIAHYADGRSSGSEWNGYAALTAAAYAKELLLHVSPDAIRREDVMPLTNPIWPRLRHDEPQDNPTVEEKYKHVIRRVI